MLYWWIIIFCNWCAWDMLNTIHKDIILSVESHGGLNMASTVNRDLEIGFMMLFLPADKRWDVIQRMGELWWLRDAYWEMIWNIMMLGIFTIGGLIALGWWICGKWRMW